jgi:hypothetical protein
MQPVIPDLTHRIPVFLDKTQFFRHPQKNDPHIRVLAAFPGSGWDKLCGKNHLDLNDFGSHYTRCKSALFWQSKRDLNGFSTRTEKESFTGFSGIGMDIWKGKGA